MAELKPFDGELDAAPTLKPFTGTLDGEKQSKGFAGDVGKALKQGVQELPGVVTGLADIPLGLAGLDRPISRLADRAGAATGFQPGKWAKETAQQMSPQTQAARAEIDQVWADPDAGALDVAGAYARNPRATALQVVQSVPSIAAGGVAGRVAGTVARLSSAPARAALGEGAVMAGQQMANIDESVDPQKAAAAALATGAAGAAIGGAGSAFSAAKGVRDIDTTFTGGAVSRSAEKAPGLVRRVATGAVHEGAEEAAQSAFEQGAQNVAEDKPLTEGMARNVVEGTLAGSVMGAGAGAVPRAQQLPAPAPRTEDVDPTVGTSVGDGMGGTGPVAPSAAPAQKPSEAMGIDPAAGPLSRAAADAVDSGAAQEIQAAQAAQQQAEEAAKAKPGEKKGAPAEPEQQQPLATAPLQREAPTIVNPTETPDVELQAGRPASAIEPAQPPQNPSPAPDAGAPAVAPAPARTLDSGNAVGGTAAVGDVSGPSDSAQSVNAPPAPRGSFTSAEQAYAYIRQQRRAGGTRMDALPLPLEDGSFGVALRGTDEYPVAEFHAKQRALRARGVAEGDILAKSGEPFKNRLAAGHALRQAGAGHQVVQVQDGFVVRKGAADVSEPGATGGLAAGSGRPAGGDDRAGVAAAGPAPDARAGRGADSAARAAPDGQQDLAARDAGGPADAVGLRPATLAESIEADANAAATSPANDLPEPSDGQKEAGNYKKGHLKLHGLDITIENPRGSTRSGRDPSGKPWSVEMPAHYGYVKRTTGADGDQVDVYIGDNPESPHVFVVDQQDARTKAWDEHKVILGARSRFEAARLYDAGFSDGRGKDRRRAITQMTVDEFKAWLRKGDTTQPAKQVSQPQEQPRAEESPQAAAEAQPRQARGAEARADLPDAGQPAAAAPVEGVPEGGAAQAVKPAGERFPRVDSVKFVSVGPGGVRPRAIAAGKPLYRETNASGLDSILMMDRQFDVGQMFVADSQDLAIGQGDNRGVHVVFRPDSLSGKEHAKPGTGGIAGREYSTDVVAPRAVQAVTFDAADAVKKLRMLTRRTMAQEFDRQDLPDGRVHFTRKGLESVAPPAAIEKPGLKRMREARAKKEVGGVPGPAARAGTRAPSAVPAEGAGQRATMESRSRSVARPPDKRQSADVVSETGPDYTAPYEQDLFGNPVPAASGAAGAAAAGAARVRRDAQPSRAVRDTPAPEGEFRVRTIVGATSQRKLGAALVRTPRELAQATSYLFKSAVERLDGVVTDSAGRPLAVVGGFKGALAETRAYPSTIVGEAVRIPGAANIWFAHNHPSGSAEVSRADVRMMELLSDVFRGSGIEPRGLIAVTGEKFSFTDGTAQGAAEKFTPSVASVTVPVVEREQVVEAERMPAMTTPAQAVLLAKTFYEAAKAPGLILVDTQLRPTAWVPLPRVAMGRLRNTGGLRAVYRAVSEANASAAVIVHGGELDGRVSGEVTLSQNIAAALEKAEVRALDSINALTGSSVAQTSLKVANGPVFKLDENAVAEQTSDKRMVELQQMVDAISEGWARKPEIIIARHLLDRQLPAEVLESVAASFSRGTGAPQGVYFRGKVYLIAQTIPDLQQARTVLLHEALGHYGLRGVFGEAIDTVRRQVLTMRRAEVLAKAEAYGMDINDQEQMLLAAEEVLAEMAQARPEIGFVQRAVAAIRAWLRAHGFTSLKLTDNDIIANYLLPARGFVERGRAADKAPSSSAPRPAFSLDMRAARAFLDGEPVATLRGDEFKPDGEPLTVKVPRWYREHGVERVDAPGIGVVQLDERAVKSSVGHGLSRAKASAFAAVPEVLQRGRIIHREPLAGARDAGEMVYVAAPVRIGDKDMVEVVLVKTDSQAKRMYVHEVAVREGLQQSAFKTGAGAAAKTGVPTGAEAGAIRSVLERIYGDKDAPADEPPAFSRSPTDFLKGVTATDLRARAGYTATDYRGLALQTLGRRQLVELYAKDLPQLTEYSKLVQQMDADKNEAGAGADAIAERWGKLPDEAALANLMHDATLAQMDPAVDLVKGDDPLTHARLRKAYDALSPEARKIYAEARDTYRAHHENVRQAIRDRIERSDLRGPRKAELLKQMDDEFFKAIKGVYFPLARFGDYVVVVRGDDGQAISVSRAETMHEAQALRAELVKAYPKNEVGKVLKAKEFNAGRDMVGRGFMQELYGALAKKDMDEKQRGELEDMLGQLYLSALPDLSWAKHGIHRKGTAGFSQDARRAFAQNTFHGARYLAKIRYSDLLEAELTAMQKHVDSLARTPGYDSVRAQQVVDEMNKRHDAYMNPQANPLSTALTSLGFIFHLGLSPASAMVNLTQTALVAYPIMGARWGFTKASAALLKASQQAAANRNDISTTLSPEERRAFDEAVRSGVIDVTMAHDLAGISQGEDAKVSWKLRPVMKWASFLFHHAEKFNRQVTFVAAYRLAREAGTAPAAAYDQAVKATYDGHFDYSAGNRPRLMQGNVAKVVLLFKQYAQNMVYTLSRQAYLAVKGLTPAERAEARKALGGLLAMHASAAGVLGLPLVTTLLGVASMLGGSDDEPWDAEVALRNMLADTFGAGPADVIARGLSRATPWDISGRVGLDKLIFPDLQEGLEGQRLAESAMAAALGPVAGIGVNLLKGMQSAADGQWARGLEEMAPSVLRGPIKALRYGTEGAIDRTGKPIVEDVGALGVAGQALGFSPSEVRLATEAKSAIHQADDKLKKRRAALMRHYAMAVINEDGEGAADAKEAIQAFNEKNPDRRINAMQMAQSVRQRRKQIAESEQGMYLPKNRRGAMEAGRFGVAE